jgi:hypothetical protein
MSKITKAKWTGSEAQAYKALSLNPTQPIKKKRERKWWKA